MWFARLALLGCGFGRAREGMVQEGAAEAQTLSVDAVSDALRDMPFDRMAGLAERLARHEHGIDGNYLVHVAVHQQDRRAFTWRGQSLKRRERTRVTDDGFRWVVTSQPHGERHHGALAEADEAKRSCREVMLGEFLIEQIRELTAMLPVIDPDPGTAIFGPEEAALADYDDVDDFLNATFSPPISAARLPLNDFSQFSQHVTVQTIEPANLEQVSATHKGFVRVTVTVSMSSKEISSANWIRATH